jgi:steroid delta-isomerase-like uncharacterized protein
VTGTQPAKADVDVLAERWLAAWLGAARFADCCTADVGYEDPLLQMPISGPSALDERSERLREAFPDIRVERTAPALERGGHACLPWRAVGTQTGDLAALPASDRFITLHGLHYVELTDGRVRRARGFFDVYDGAVQLGLLPRKGGLGEAALMLLRGFGLRR